MTKIVEDRTLAHIAYEVAAGIDLAEAGKGVDIAVGQAVVMLRVMGVTAGPQILRTLRADIQDILAEPAKMARARGIDRRSRHGHPANANFARAGLSAVG